MRSITAAAVACVALATTTASAHGRRQAGPLVDVAVDVAGTTAPLYAAADGSGKLYVEARAGAEYAIRLQNRTGERVAVQLVVDGLNVISGERDTLAAPGRLYVLQPWSGATVSGWRTSLSEVRRFTFVDEKRSYAARAGKSTARVGWIEAAAYREVHAAAVARKEPWSHEDEERSQPRAEADAAEAPPSTRQKAQRGADSAGGSFPGTGWGERAADHVQVVSFEPERTPAQRTVLRYEYAASLRALGVLPRRDRLAERERGATGFAPAPLW